MLEQIELLVEKVCGGGHHSRARVGGVELNRLNRVRRNLVWQRGRPIKRVYRADHTEPRELAARPRVQGIEGDRLAQRFLRRAKGCAAILPPHHVTRAQDKVVSLDFIWALARRQSALGNLDHAVATGDLGDNLAHDLVLNEEDVDHLTIEPVGPDVSAGFSVDELRRDAKAVVGAPDAALEHVAHLELAPKLGYVHRLPLVLKCRVACEHMQVVRPRQLGQNVLGQAVAEILLFRIAAQIGEGENGDYRALSIRPTLSCWRLPQLDVRRVAALWQLDANGIALAVGVVVFAKLVTQARGLDAHERIDRGVKRVRTTENLYSDVVALQPLTAPGKSFIDEVLQELLPAL